MAVSSLAMDQAALIDADDNPRDVMALASFLLAASDQLGLLVLGWTRWIERRLVASLGLTRSIDPRTFLRGWSMELAMASVVVVAIRIAGGHAPGAVAPAFVSPRALASRPLLPACFAIQSCIAELLFRGWMFSVVTRQFHPAVAVVLSRAVFALLHVIHRQPAPVAAGILLFSMLVRYQYSVRATSPLIARPSSGLWNLRVPSASCALASESNCS